MSSPLFAAPKESEAIARWGLARRAYGHTHTHTHTRTYRQWGRVSPWEAQSACEEGDALIVLQEHLQTFNQFQQVEVRL
jgi:hypothetical protein